MNHETYWRLWSVSSFPRNDETTIIHKLSIFPPPWQRNRGQKKCKLLIYGFFLFCFSKLLLSLLSWISITSLIMMKSWLKKTCLVRTSYLAMKHLPKCQFPNLFFVVFYLDCGNGIMENCRI